MWLDKWKRGICTASVKEKFISEYASGSVITMITEIINHAWLRTPCLIAVFPRVQQVLIKVITFFVDSLTAWWTDRALQVFFSWFRCYYKSSSHFHLCNYGSWMHKNVLSAQNNIFFLNKGDKHFSLFSHENQRTFEWTEFMSGRCCSDIWLSTCSISASPRLRCCELCFMLAGFGLILTVNWRGFFTQWFLVSSFHLGGHYDCEMLF